MARNASALSMFMGSFCALRRSEPVLFAGALIARCCLAQQRRFNMTVPAFGPVS